MAIYQYGEHRPAIHEDVYIADTADVIGQVTLSARSSVWYQAVLRGDSDHLEIGEESNIQDGAVLHADPGYPLKVGKGVTVGHQAMLHGCTVGDGCLIGIQAVVLNGAVIGENSLVGAGAFIKEGATFPQLPDCWLARSGSAGTLGGCRRRFKAKRTKLRYQRPAAC